MFDPNITPQIIVILLRLLVPFTILRWPLAGTILAILADTSDVLIFDYFDYGFLSGIQYHVLDKIFDMWQLFFEFLVVLRWKDVLAKNIGKFLFGWRFIGFVVFLIFGVREVFVFAPNIFEFFFLAMLIIWKFKPKFKLNKKSLIIILLIVGIPNIIKEYLMHLKYQDQVSNFFRDNLFPWLYN